MALLFLLWASSRGANWIRGDLSGELNVLLLWEIPLAKLLLSVVEVGKGGSDVDVNWSSKSVVLWLWISLWWGNVIPLMAKVLLSPGEGIISVVDLR